MSISILTQKGQTTIPKEIRDYLNLESGDKVIYVRDGKRVYMQTIRGDIRGAPGMFRKASRKPVDFKALREKTKEQVARKADKH